MKNYKIAVVGLGYVGLPLATLLSTKFEVIGFDISKTRIDELKSFHDKTGEIESIVLKNIKMDFTFDETKLSQADIIIVTVPTPIDEHNVPDLSPVYGATKTVAKNMKKSTIVVYESTVYPGVTEDECVPLLENVSGLTWKKDFNVGYSPERVNPGDKKHTIDKILKVVSGDTSETLSVLSSVYGSVVSAGIHQAPTIKVAEAAKVIENTQRDLNIALMNELSIIFNKMNINTNDVLEAAGTKWNFLKFFPGLVGGHCIGVDPYYLTFKAQSIGYHPEVILAGRRINDQMASHVVSILVKNLIKSGKEIKNQKVLIAGFTFKENVPDIRNTKVIDIYNELKEFGIIPMVYEPIVPPSEIEHEYQIPSVQNINGEKDFVAVILAVKHEVFEKEFTLSKCIELQKGTPILADIKSVFKKTEVEKTHPELVYFSL